MPFRCRLRATIFQRSFLGKTKDDASQLNRLGVAYFHLCLLPISTTCYFGFSSAHSRQFLLLIPAQVLAAVEIRIQLSPGSD